MENLTLEDVRNMKFDGPLNEFDTILGLAAKCRRDRERKALEEEPVGENPASTPPVDISKKVERVTGEKTTPIKNPNGIAVGKKMKVMPRDITKEDTKHLEGKQYTSAFDFNLLVDIGTVARKLYKEAARELTKSQSESEEEEPSNEDQTPCFPSPLDISKNKNKKCLINEAYVEEEKEKFSISPRVEEDFCCPTPKAATKRKRLMVEKSLKKPRVIDKTSEVIMKKTRTSNNKVTWKGANGYIYESLDDYKPDLPEFLKGKIREENGSEVKLVIQKQLTKTDLDSNQNRVSVPFSMLNCTDFLTVSEQEYLIQREPDGSLSSIKVLFIEPNGDRNVELVFKRWVMAKEKNNKGLNNVSNMYVINGNGKWKDVFQKHELKVGMIVQLWSFRYDGWKLGFAMVIVGMVETTEAKTNGNANRNKNRNRNGNGHGSSESWSGNGTSGSQDGDQAGESGLDIDQIN